MIQRWLNRLHSFGDKLSWLLMLTSGGAIIAVCLALAILDYLDMRREALASLHAQAMIVAMNSGAPMTFGDPASAEEALEAFRFRPGVAEATLFDLRGTPFARYVGAHTAPPALPAQPPGLSRIDRWAVLVLPIEEHQQVLGRLQVVFDLDRTRLRLWRSLLLAGAVTVLAVGLVYLFSRAILTILMRPIAALGRTVEQVAATKDYALRAEKISDDELGAFTDAFNAMLIQIQQQDQELQTARAEAEAASRLKDEFLATLSHELRTPLSPILGWAQILRRVAGDDPRLQQAAQVIERSARCQTQIVDDLLDMSRIVSGKLRLELQPVELCEVIEAALDTVRSAAEGKQVELLCQLESAVVRGDPHRLQQVAWNLLTNAIKFTEPGGQVRISLRRGERHATITVSDSGQGIEPAFLPYVFERFRQADSSITRSHGGLGLGLSIARQLVELHGGSVRVSSPGLGHGAAFSVLLPMQAAAESPVTATTPIERRASSRATPLPPTRRTSLAGLHLLLVEDDPDSRELIRQLLHDAGTEIRVVGSAEQALSALQAAPPDVLICSMTMADTDCFALIRTIRQLVPEQGGATPAIALTGSARSEERAGALLAGFQLHVAKPVEQAELRAAVASLARRRAPTAAGTPPPGAGDA
jgi:signal transduction histidine kinase/ActR/RegA family two-component response regulator